MCGEKRTSDVTVLFTGQASALLRRQQLACAALLLAAAVLALLPRNREVLVSNLGLETLYLWLRFVVVSLSPSRQMPR